MELTLAEHQIPAFKGILRTLDSTMFYYDPSGTGEGKTEIGLYTAQQCNQFLYIICPANVRDVWTRRAAKYGLSDRLLFVTSYDSAIMPGDSCLKYPGLKVKDNAKAQDLAKAMQYKRDSGYHRFDLSDFTSITFKMSVNSLVRKKTVRSLTNVAQADQYFSGEINEIPVPRYQTLAYYEVVEKNYSSSLQYYMEDLIQGKAKGIKREGTLFIFDEAH